MSTSPTFKFSLFAVSNLLLLLICGMGQEAWSQSTELESLNNEYVALLHEEQYLDALPIAEQIITLVTQEHGKGSLPHTNGLEDLAELYMHLGRYEDAELLYLRAVEFYKHNIGENDTHSALAATFSNLGAVYIYLNQLAKAEKALERELSLLEAQIESDFLSIAINLTGLANVYQKQGRISDAEEFLNRALKMQEDKIPVANTNKIDILIALATLYEDQNRDNDADAYYQRAIKLFYMLIDEEHRKYTEFMELYKFSDAADVAQRFIDLVESYLGKEHQHYAAGIMNLAEVYRGQGKYDMACPLLESSLLINKKLFGPVHKYVSLIK
jgi:tetratricopeptide (TPR) repeat protein